MGAASAVLTALKIPLILTCQPFHYDCECLSCEVLLSLIWCPLLPHISVQLCIEHVVPLLSSPDGISLPDTKYFPCFPKTTLGRNNTFCHFHSSFLFFFHSLRHLSRSPAACFSIPCPPASLSHTSSPLTLTQWSHSSYASASIFSRMIGFLSGSYPQGVDVTALILAGVNMSWVAALLCDSGKLAIFWMYNARKITLIWVGFMMHSNEFHFTATTVENTLLWWTQTLRPSCNLTLEKLTLDHFLQGNTAH